MAASGAGRAAAAVYRELGQTGSIPLLSLIQPAKNAIYAMMRDLLGELECPRVSSAAIVKPRNPNSRRSRLFPYRPFSALKAKSPLRLRTRSPSGQTG